MVKMVEQLISKFRVIGSTPTTHFEFFLLFFIHIFIIFSIHYVSPAVVEACLKKSYCSIAQSKGTPIRGRPSRNAANTFPDFSAGLSQNSVIVKKFSNL